MKHLSVVFLMATLLVAFQTSAASAKECVSTLNSQVCVGESHDSVIAKIDKSYSTGQRVSQGMYGMIVERDYNYHGERFTLRFERTAREGPYRLVKISR